jgi:CRISPR-associated protein (Cas_Cas02710)
MSKGKRGSSLGLKQIFSPETPLQFIGLAIVSVLFNLLSSLNIIGLIGVPLLALAFAGSNELKQRKLRKIFQILPPEPKVEQPLPARGLILVLSPYSPSSESLKKDPKKLNAMIEAIVDKNAQVTLESFEQIEIFNSNLKPQIEAVKFHAQKGELRDLWLISSETYDMVQGSEKTAKLLKKYLSIEEYGKRIWVHDDHIVKEYDYGGLCKAIEGIFRESKINDEDLVVDVTGGTKMMSVAVAIACIPRGRKMQYMNSQRDWKGVPLERGEMSPVVIDIDPLIDQYFEQ